MRREATSPWLHVELFQRDPANPILTAQDWPYPAHSVFNAGACQSGDETILLARVEDRRGHSHLCVARSNDGVGDWQIAPQPSFVADPANFPEEAWGVEDPRLTWIEDRGEWIIAYTAYSTSGPLVSLATTKDFVHFTRIGAVMPPDDKDAAIFPRRFGNRYAMIHRPVSAGLGAHMWLSFSPDLIHWGDHHILLHARRGAWWDANKIGLSPPPLETPEGWLVLYHGVRVTAGGCLYRLGLALLDLEDPSRVLRAATSGSLLLKCHTNDKGMSTAWSFRAVRSWTRRAGKSASTMAVPTVVWRSPEHSFPSCSTICASAPRSHSHAQEHDLIRLRA